MEPLAYIPVAKRSAEQRMYDLRKTLSGIEELDERRLEHLMREGSTPDAVFAALLSIFDGYVGASDNFANIPECHWLYDFAQDAIDRVLTLVAEASGEDPDAVKAMLYRAIAAHVSANQELIYDGFEDQNPFGEEPDDGENVEEAWAWPIVNEQPGNGEISATFQQFSALKLFGYTVGKTAGWPREQRRRFLSDFIEQELPANVRHIFGDEYGEPMTSTRLRKVANVIANNCSLRLRNNPQKYRHAIEDWVDDLQFLKEKYYDGLGLKFLPWPDPHDI